MEAHAMKEISKMANIVNSCLNVTWKLFEIFSALLQTKSHSLLGVGARDAISFKKIANCIVRAMSNIAGM